MDQKRAGQRSRGTRGSHVAQLATKASYRGSLSSRGAAGSGLGTSTTVCATWFRSSRCRWHDPDFEIPALVRDRLRSGRCHYGVHDGHPGGVDRPPARTVGRAQAQVHPSGRCGQRRWSAQQRPVRGGGNQHRPVSWVDSAPRAADRAGGSAFHEAEVTPRVDRDRRRAAALSQRQAEATARGWQPVGSDRPGALRRRALLRTGLATLTASGSSNAR
jgi:hypothetical protein